MKFPAFAFIPILDKKSVSVTLEARPLVLCKDCKHWYKEHCAHGVCATEETDANWFCADGEPKEESDDHVPD